MWLLVLLYLCALWGSVVVGSPTSRHVLHERRSLDHRWRRERKLPSDTILPMRIGLTQQNLHCIGEFVEKVSHPDSPDYGKHWTPKQIAETFSASAETVKAVRECLSENNIAHDRHSRRRTNWLEVNMTAQEAEQLLRTEYFVHIHEESGNRKVACDDYWVPDTLREHIDLITPTVHFDTSVVERQPRRKGPRATRDIEKRIIPFSPDPNAPACPSCAPEDDPARPRAYLGNCQAATTPACVRALYGLPDPFALPKYTGEGVPVGMLEFAPNIEYPPDLDDFLDRYTNIPKGTRLRSISIGPVVPPPPLPSPGTKWGPNTKTYDFFEANGDFEIAMSIVAANDVALYEVAPGLAIENFLDAVDSTYCAANGGNGCGSLQAKDVPYVVSISYTIAENGSSVGDPKLLQRQCNEFGKLGLQGMTVLAATGDRGVGWVCTDPSTGQGFPGDEKTGSSRGLFTANFPASCPFVTAVGATAIPDDRPFAPGMIEIAAKLFPPVPPSTSPRGIISGGGFSNIFTAQPYQQPTFQHYVSTTPPHFPDYDGHPIFNNTGIARGYPDISANGYQFSVYSNGTNQPFSGTSGSTPMVAAVIALLNGERFSRNQPPLGFINPALYTNPGMLNDITEGSNPGCGQPGFSCVPGWDPVTGLGTPNYAKMSKYFNEVLQKKCAPAGTTPTGQNIEVCSDKNGYQT